MRDVVTVWEVWVDGVRADGEAYAEALERMVSADPSEQVELAGILERLGRITGTVPVPRNRLVEPVPDWLADALRRTHRTHPPRQSPPWTPPPRSTPGTPSFADLRRSTSSAIDLGLTRRRADAKENRTPSLGLRFLSAGA